jgi:Amt family ammonium transporter
LIGILGCGAYMLSSTILLKLKIDDPLDAYPIHGFCGMWGVLAVGIFGTDKNAAWAGYYGSAAGEEPFKSGDQFAVQIMGVLAITAWVAVTATLLFGGINLTIGLRVDREVEEAGLDSSEHGGGAYEETANKLNEKAEALPVEEV